MYIYTYGPPSSLRIATRCIPEGVTVPCDGSRCLCPAGRRTAATQDPPGFTVWHSDPPDASCSRRCQGFWVAP